MEKMLKKLKLNVDLLKAWHTSNIKRAGKTDI